MRVLIDGVEAAQEFRGGREVGDVAVAASLPLVSVCDAVDLTNSSPRMTLSGLRW